MKKTGTFEGKIKAQRHMFRADRSAQFKINLSRPRSRVLLLSKCPIPLLNNMKGQTNLPVIVIL